MHDPFPVPKDNERKPDPGEPWRYVCPNCYRQIKGVAKSQKFVCDNCGERFTERELHDQKANGTPDDVPGLGGPS